MGGGEGQRAGAGRAARRRAAQKIRRFNRTARTVGEVTVTFGLVMVLFFVYQFWWKNYETKNHAVRQAESLEDQWQDSAPPADPRNPGVYDAGAGFALVHIPKLGVKAPVAESTDKRKVLDRGWVGHYSEPKTAMPWDQQGNFAIAGHRRTLGEPFRYINQLQPGDSVVIETSGMYYTYTVDKTLPQTSPNNIGVINPVPKGGPFDKPGRYITLTTCTPENASTYRLIVWGHLTEERLRTDGKPDAMVKKT
jgi:sortase A